MKRDTPEVTRRTYGQLCGLARAFDVVGERWTALIIRDLTVGPRRFTDLQDGLSGIGTGLLSERLQRLEDLGIVRRVPAPRPTRGLLYELTERGADLADALMPLARWGLSMLGSGDGGADPDGTGTFRAEWLVVMLRSSFRPERAAGVHDCYQFEVMGERVWATVDDGVLETGEGEAPRPPDMTFASDAATLAGIGSGVIDPAEAVADGRTTVTGDPGAAARSLEVFGAVARRRSRPEVDLARRHTSRMG